MVEKKTFFINQLSLIALHFIPHPSVSLGGALKTSGRHKNRDLSLKRKAKAFYREQLKLF